MPLGFNRGNRKIIRAPRKEIKLDDVDQRISSLKEAFKSIFEQKKDVLSFSELYVYGRELVRDLQKKDETYDIVCEVLKHRCQHCRGIVEAVKEESFLSTIASTFWDYRQASKTIADIMMFLDFNRPEDKPRIFRHALDMFYDEVVVLVRDRMTGHLLDQIQKERDGETIDRTLLHHCSIMLHDTNCYEEVFEKDLLQVTKKYYSSQASELAKSCDVPQYLAKVDGRVRDEADRVESFLIDSSGPKIDSILREEMVTKHMEFLLEDPDTGFVSLVRDDRVEDLGRMYFLFNFSTSHLQKMIERYERYIFETGKKYVLAEDNLKDPVTFVDGILAQKKKYDIITSDSFQSRDTFVQALDSGFKRFSDGHLQKRVAECLSLYLDHSMKNNPQVDDPEFEGALDRALSVFRYLKDKKVFENYYKIHLSKRLLAAKTLNTKKAERMFLNKLKARTKKPFVAKIDGMFNDLEFSLQKCQKFAKHESFPDSLKSGETTFKVNVLTRSFWPTYTVSRTVLPKEMQNYCQAFSKFHKDLHSLRTLTWQKNLGDGILLARYPMSKVRLIATTYQMVLLLLFNETNSMTYQDISDKVQIPERDLKRNLLLMCIGDQKLLSKQPKSGNIRPDDVFTWNGHFRSDKDTIHISNSVTQKAKQQEKSSDDKPNRNPVEAAIISYLKKNKRAEFRDCAKSVMKETKAKPLAIKKEIEALIAKGFIERDSENVKTLIYKTG